MPTPIIYDSSLNEIINRPINAFDNAFASGCIQSGALGNACINSGNIASGQIGLMHLASGVITPTGLSSGSIMSGHLADGSVNSGNIASGQIGIYHLASGIKHIEQTYFFRADGFYRVASGGIDVMEAPRSFKIRNVVMRREIAGTLGTTDCDILVSGASIFTPTNRPKTYAASGNQTRVVVVPDIVDVASGARMEMAIIQAETGNPQDIVIEIISVG
ncbi:MAG: hypothetical protein QXU32_01915 [Nitrososphaerales archaeon]